MIQQRILITGACGFSGRHLVTYLCRHAPATFVAGMDTLPESTVPLDQYHCCDLTDSVGVRDAVAAIQPTAVVHLAGLMGTAPAEEIHRVNVGGFRCLTDALRQSAQASGNKIRVLTVGSAAELGVRGAEKMPVSEEATCAPDAPYGRSKWEVTQLALAEPPDSPLEIVVARSFNLVGPGLSPQLSLGNFARQIAAAVRGETNTIRTGSLDTRRDFVDVRDAVRAYAALIAHGRHGQIYNVCAGRSFRLGRMLDMLITLAHVKVRVMPDANLRRAADLPDIYGDHSKITRLTGWRPAISIEHSLADLLAAA